MGKVFIVYNALETDIGQKSIVLLNIIYLPTPGQANILFTHMPPQLSYLCLGELLLCVDENRMISEF